MIDVIFADDEPRACEWLKTSVDWNALGFRIVGVASDGLHCLNMIRELNPQLVIADISMPRMNGIELFAELARTGVEIEKIVISGFDEFKFAQESIRYGVLAYLLKPVDKLDLEIALSEAKQRLSQGKGAGSGHMPPSSVNTLLHSLLFVGKPEWNSKQLDQELPGVRSAAVYWVECHSFPEGPFDFDTVKKRFLELLGYPHSQVLYQQSKAYVFCHAPGSGAYPDRREKIRELIAQMNAEFGISICCGLSHARKSLGDITGATREALLAMMRQYLDGPGNYFVYQPVQDDFNDHSQRFRSKLGDALFCLKAAETDACIAEIRQALRRCFLDADILHVRLVNLYTSISASLRSKNVTFRSIDDHALYISLKTCPSFDEAVSCFEREIRSIFNQMQQLSQNDSSYLTARVIDYVQRNYDRNITLPHAAEYVFFSPGHVSKTFKKVTGKHFNEYLRDLRVEKAKELVRTTHYQIQHISQMVGFTDYRYFCTVFKKVTGQTPLGFRMSSFSSTGEADEQP